MWSWFTMTFELLFILRGSGASVSFVAFVLCQIGSGGMVWGAGWIGDLWGTSCTKSDPHCPGKAPAEHDFVGMWMSLARIGQAVDIQQS